MYDLLLNNQCYPTWCLENKDNLLMRSCNGAYIVLAYICVNIPRLLMPPPPLTLSLHQATSKPRGLSSTHR